MHPVSNLWTPDELGEAHSPESGLVLPTGLGNMFDNPEISGMFEEFAASVEGLKGDDKAAYDNLEFYADHVLAWENPEYVPSSSFQKRIYNELQYSNERSFLILGPRGSAKSNSVTVAYTTWKIGRNPLIRFLMCFAAKEQQGYPFSRQIATIIENNERYKRIFGELHKPSSKNRWADEERTVDRKEPPSGLKDATISIVGFGSNIPSKRADEAVVDDIVTEDNAYSDTLQTKIESFVISSLFPILIPGGRRIILGSRWDARDFYARIAERWRLTFPDPDQSIDLDNVIESMVELQVA